MTVDKGQIVQNAHTLPRVVFKSFLKSFLRHSPDFQYSDELRETRVAVLDSANDLKEVPEAAARIIIQRQAMRGQTVFADSRVKYDGKMFTHSIAKPHLGAVNIYCESRNDVHAEYLATRIESVIIAEEAMLTEQGIMIATPSVSDVQEPLSGTSFYSMVLNVPIMVVGITHVELKDPRMLEDISTAFGVGPLVNIQIETDSQ